MVTLTEGQPEVRSVSTEDPHAPSRPDDKSTNAHRQLIGYIGLVLPFLLIFITLNRDGEELWKKLESISAYYYTGALAAFVGMLVGLALFLFTYRGYANRYNNLDRWAAVIAAIDCLMVAFYPTKAPESVTALSWWQPYMNYVHHIGAVVVFTIFAVFALFLFRLTPPGEQLAPDKRWRNRIYLVCGLVIVASILWAAVNGLNGKSIFWPESVALIAFSISWLVKGYAHRTIARAVRMLIGSH